MLLAILATLPVVGLPSKMQGVGTTNAGALPHPPVVTALQSSAPPTPLTTEIVATGLTSPVAVASAPGDSTRLFIVEQYTGRIELVKNGALMGTPFFQLQKPLLVGGEQGLLGLVFDPAYSSNGYFYINYTASPSGNTVIERYSVSPNPDIAIASNSKLILSVPQPFANHNGGTMHFGPDGYLYIGMGDGGSDADPQSNGQNLNTLLGKMLRIDVNTPAGIPYAIPPSNPFIGVPGARPEIWAFGLRNPWKFSFDSLTGDLYIADVGLYDWEELNFQPAGSLGGQNYGWSCYEGNGHPAPGHNCNPPNVTWPFYEYKHSMLPGCAIVGGQVYRGFKIPDLRGTYFFSEWCKSTIYSLRYQNGVISEFKNRTLELAPADPQYFIGPVSSHGVDADGEMYLVDYVGGEVFRIIAASPVVQGVYNFGDGTPGCAGKCTLVAESSPVVGNPHFNVRAAKGASVALGLLIVGDAISNTGLDVFNLGFVLYFDIPNLTEVAGLDLFSGPNGNSTATIAIPNNPQIVGSTWLLQGVWYWELGNCNGGSFSSTEGLVATILP